MDLSRVMSLLLKGTMLTWPENIFNIVGSSKPTFMTKIVTNIWVDIVIVKLHISLFDNSAIIEYIAEKRCVLLICGLLAFLLRKGPQS